MMNTAERIDEFNERFGGFSNAARPIWIQTRIEDKLGYGTEFLWDFKNDIARKSFGALCHCLFTSNEEWTVKTKALPQ